MTANGARPTEVGGLESQERFFRRAARVVWSGRVGRRSVAGANYSVIILALLALGTIAFAGLGSVVTVEVTGIAEFPIVLDDDSLQATDIVKRLAAKRSPGKLHRAEDLPPEGSTGPPYALIQFSLPSGGLLDKLPHQGSRKIKCGSVCLIGSASELFISLARNNEHDGWETGMTVIGHVPEPSLTHLQQVILQLPKHNFTHPQYGTVMSMLNEERELVLRE